MHNMQADQPDHLDQDHPDQPDQPNRPDHFTILEKWATMTTYRVNQNNNLQNWKQKVHNDNSQNVV